MSTGANLQLALKRNPNAWGSGAAVQCGAGDQIEVESESLAPDVTLIENVGLSGQATQLPGFLGNRIVANAFGPCPLYYRGLGLPVALAMGTEVAPAQLGGSAAYEHALKMKASHAGLNATLAAAGVDHPAVREIPHCKIDGFTFDFQQNQLGKLTVPIIGFDLYPNETPDDDAIVASLSPPANGDMTIAGQPDPPSRLTVTVTDGDASITELIVDFYGEDDSGRYVTERYQLSVDTLSWVSSKRWSKVTKATLSGLAGTATGDAIKVGVQQGINNLGNFSSIALPTSADRIGVAFAHVRLWINDQDGADFADADEHFATSIRISLQNGLSRNFSTRYGNRPDEPAATGNFKQVELGVNFHTWDSANNPQFKRRLMAKRSKVKITAQGPIATGMDIYPLEWSFFLNNVQWGQGSPNAGGPGNIAFDLTGMAHRTLTDPTGLPSWADKQPLSVREVNLRTTAYLS